MSSKKDWVMELAKKGNMPSTNKEMEDMIQQMDRLGLRGAYNPKNLYPGSPWTPSSFPKPDEVRAQAKAGSSKVRSDYHLLRKIYLRHGETISKRWIKKTRKKQKEILLEAWPKMSECHRPDFEAYRKENTGRRHQGLSNFQEAYLWPYINLQDLSSKALLIFIQSRAENPPSVFARGDIEAVNLASVTHMIEEPAFLAGYTLFMDGDSGDEYGRLVSWEEDEKAMDLMFSRRQFTPGDGLLVLRIQERVYAFLIKCCEIILHDHLLDGTLFGEDSEPPASQEVVPTSADSEPAGKFEILPTLASISIETPYRVPAKLDFERIKAVMEARRSASEDHLWMLREDPGYFADTINDWSQHRNDRLLDTNGNPHPTGPHTTDFWERVIRNVIADAYSGYMGWDLLLKMVERLIGLRKKYDEEIVYEKQLPKEYLIELLKFRELLKISCETPIFYLRNIQSSPPLRQYFTRDPQSPGTINMSIRPINPIDPFFHKPWGLLLILWDEKQRELFGLCNVIDAFEALMMDSNEKRNISPYMSDLLGDLGILTRVLKEIEGYWPWAGTFDDEFENNRKEIMTILQEAKPQMEFMEHMDVILKGIVSYGMPGDGKFNYPTDKKRTKQVTEQMRKAEENLDVFWGRFDGRWVRITGGKMGDLKGMEEWSYRGLKVERTEPWVERIEAAENPKGTKGTKEWVDTPDEKVPATTKQKTKTKGTANTSSSATATEQSTITAKPNHPIFMIPNPLMRVFQTLFYTPNLTSKPGEIPWQDFLKAMVCVGFKVQKLYGSIWQFTSEGLEGVGSRARARKDGEGNGDGKGEEVGKGRGERGILFHEPHPSVKVSFVVARRMGRRLERAFGWGGGWFKGEE